MVDVLTVVPPGCRPQSVSSSVVKEVHRPRSLCLVNSLMEVFDCHCVGLALGGGNTCEGGLTVKVPPSEAPKVQHVAVFEVSA